MFVTALLLSGSECLLTNSDKNPPEGGFFMRRFIKVDFFKPLMHFSYEINKLMEVDFDKNYFYFHVFVFFS